MNPFRAFILPLAGFALFLLLLPILLFYRFKGSSQKQKPRLFWGTTSIISMAMNAKALRDKGFCSDAVAITNPGFYMPEGFSHVITETGAASFWKRRIIGTAKSLLWFIRTLKNYDIFHFFFTGGLLRKTPLGLWEPWLLRLAGKKVIIFPYGSDAFAPGRIPYLSWRAALLSDYPTLGGQNKEISQRIDRYCADANLVVGCLVHLVTLPRWDSLMLTCYPVETEKLKPVFPTGKDKTLKIFHAPNHKGVKGTTYLVEAVDKLQKQGLKLELDLVQGVSRAQVLTRMSRADLVVDQLFFGYGLTAMEAMALGKMVISGKNPKEHDQIFDGYGLKECPIIWSSPDGIEDSLCKLLAQPENWNKVGQQSRWYVEQYHSYDVTAENWIALYEKLGYIYK